MNQRTRRSPARFFAPLALIAVVAALLMIVGGSGGDSGSSPGAGTSADTATNASKTTATSKKAAPKAATKKAAADAKTYTVQVGDTFGGIADKTGVPLDRLEELNPAVDSHAMTVGQKIKLK
jgi:LysM repeat protein